MAVTTNHGWTLLEESQYNKHITINEAFSAIDDLLGAFIVGNSGDLIGVDTDGSPKSINLGTSLAISTNTLNVAAGGITQSMLANNIVYDEAVQSIALNASPPTIVYASGGCILVTGATTGTTINLPSAPSAGDKITFLNTATAAWTLSGNGKLIEGSSSLNFPASRVSPLVIVYDGSQWRKTGIAILEGTWTPTLWNGGENLVPTYTIQNGFYTVVGNTVTLWGQVSYSSKTNTDYDTTNVRLGGVPSWLMPASGQKIVGLCGDTNGLAGYRCTLDYGTVSAGTFTFMKALNTPLVTWPDLAGDAGDGIFFSITYRIA